MNNSTRTLCRIAIVGLFAFTVVISGCTAEVADESCQLDEHGQMINPDECFPIDLNSVDVVDNDTNTPVEPTEPPGSQPTKLRTSSGEGPEPEPWEPANSAQAAKMRWELVEVPERDVASPGL